MANVLFKFGTLAQYNALDVKDTNTLYWLTDVSELRKGEQLFGTGAEASSTASGLLSAEDYVKLQELIAAGPASQDLVPVDGSIIISEGKIGVGVSATDGNLIKVVDDGIFVAVDTVEISQVNGLEDRLTDIENAAVGGVHYRGSVATKDELPTDAMQGDLYECIDTGIEYCWNGTEWFEYGSAHFVPVAGVGIAVDGSEISVKIAPESHGLVAVDGAMALSLATTSQDGAMSKEDKKFIDAIPETYATIARVEDTTLHGKYEITDTPDGTLINYGEKEIRVMCPADTKFVKQEVGVGGDPNQYYITFKTYAPSDDVVGYIEHINDQHDSEILTSFSTDKYGRRYQPTWLGVASYDEDTDTWTYFGEYSGDGKYIGWNYQIDWYDANNKLIASDIIRINLSNENCHNTIVPYYMVNYATTEQVGYLQEALSWTEI